MADLGLGAYLMFYHDEMYKPLIDLIEDLREVVNKQNEWFDPALWILNEGEICFWCYRWKKEGHKIDCIRNNLPDWIKEPA